MVQFDQFTSRLISLTNPLMPYADTHRYSLIQPEVFRAEQARQIP